MPRELAHCSSRIDGLFLVRIFTSLFLLLGLAISGNAQTAPQDSVLQLPGLTVTATRIPVDPLDAPTRVDVVTLNKSERVASLASVMSKRGRVYVRSYGPTGVASLSVRGSSPSQTAFLIDGIQIVNPQLGQLDATIVSLLGIGSIEVSGGSGSALYGANAYGGSVNLRTALPHNPEMVFQAESGSFGSRKLSTLVSAVRGRYGVSVGVNHSRFEGDFDYMNYASFPEKSEKRKNADSRTTSAFGKVAGQASTINIYHMSSSRGLPGLAGSGGSGERQTDRQTKIWANRKTRVASGLVVTTAMIQTGSLRYINPTLAIDDLGATRVVDADIAYSASVRSEQILNVAYSYRWAHARHPSLVSPNATISAHAIRLNSNLESGKILIYPSVRVDIQRKASSWSTILSPRLGVNLPIKSKKESRIRFNLGRAFRSPTLNDLYWRSAGAAGNQELRSETGWTGDAGYIHKSRTLELELGTFVHSLRNQIVWSTTSAGVWTPVNVNRVHSAGIESAIRLFTQISNVEIESGADYSFVRAVNKVNTELPSHNKQLRYTPRHRGSVFVDASLSRFSALISSNFTGQQNVTASGSERLASHIITSTELTYIVPYRNYRLDLTLGAHNLFNAEYSFVKGYPMPLRNYSLSLTMNFNPSRK